MSELPFDIPPSLYSYLEQYESAPDKTTRRLEKQLQKRGADAVGYFLLAWFYYKQEKQAKAVNAALKAKIFAPGSPLFEKLHYFFSHPHLFKAWCTREARYDHASGGYGISKSGPVLDLDKLIEKLSEVESTRVWYEQDGPGNHGSSMAEESDDVEDIVSETLAKIHEQQGKYQAAIEAYKRLKVTKKDKQSFYDERIAQLQQKIDDQSN